MQGVDGVLFGVAFRPKAIFSFSRIPLGRERTGGMFLSLQLSRYWVLPHPRFGLALLLS